MLMVAAVAAVLATGAVACDSTETVTIDSVEYVVPERWCDKKIDSTELADPATLVRIPYEFTFDSSRIYVTRETRDAFVRMAEAAKKAGLDLRTDSGYRSPGFQKRIIKRRMEKGDSFEEVARFTAPPGYSQHHTGRAVDLVPSEARFAHTEMYEWLKEHAGAFGFAETYPEPEVPAEIMYWESWHWYFVGVQERVVTQEQP